MTQPESAEASDRKAAVAALDAAVRHATGLGVMFSQAVAARLRLSPTELECLDHILMGTSVTAGSLAEVTGLTSGAITGLIDRLEAAGYARRARDPADRRRVLVQATPAARMRAIPYYEGLQQRMERLVDGYSDAELALLLDYFRRAATVMQDEIARLEAERPLPRPTPRPRKERPA
jgi:DNA-binding MarR family transcriptional regulator